VIKKPRGRGGHSPRWAAEPEKILILIMMMMMMMIIIIIIITCRRSNEMVEEKKKTWVNYGEERGECNRRESKGT
jgi:hypothetical protein